MSCRHVGFRGGGGLGVQSAFQVLELERKEKVTRPYCGPTQHGRSVITLHPEHDLFGQASPVNRTFGGQDVGISKIVQMVICLSKLNLRTCCKRYKAKEMSSPV